jgi:hypothetical protein
MIIFTGESSLLSDSDNESSCVSLGGDDDSAVSMMSLSIRSLQVSLFSVEKLGSHRPNEIQGSGIVGRRMKFEN